MTEVKIKFKDDAEARKVAAWLAEPTMDAPISDKLAESIGKQIEEQVLPEYPEGTFAPGEDGRGEASVLRPPKGRLLDNRRWASHDFGLERG